MFPKVLGKNKSYGAKTLTLDKTRIIVVYMFVFEFDFTPYLPAL